MREQIRNPKSEIQSMRRFYALPENFQDGKIILNTDETRHLRDVLRLRAGAAVQVFDGTGKEFSAEIETIAKKETVLKIIRELAPAAPESNLELTLAAALLKGEKLDLVIQKAVELGVSAFVPLITKRCDVRLNDAGRKLERWQKIILEAGKQCGRARLMQIAPPIEFEKFVKTAKGCVILFTERDGRRGFSGVKSGQKMTAIIGPEGGWENSEIETAAANGFHLITFGGRILRAETAAISITAILQNHFGDFN